MAVHRVLTSAFRPRALIVLVLTAVVTGCSPIYVLRAGYEEAKILSRRQPIARLVNDASVPEETREKLRLVLRARAFAQDSLRLNVGESYTTFSQLDSDTLAMIVSAAHRDRFEMHTWWFPIVGHVPYKGYFSVESAQRAAANLEARGMDTYIRPTAAFSTLGWFNDPLVSSLLRYDSVSLAATVIHELVHNTIYLPGQGMFNESFAEFVGSRGAVAMFCGEDPESRECTQAQAFWADQLMFGRYLTDLVSELEALYGREDLTSEEKIVRREEVFTRAQQTFADSIRPQLRVATYASFTREPLNNALLISRRLYYYRLDLFEELFQRMGGDLRATVALVLDATRGSRDPYGAVQALLEPAAAAEASTRNPN